MKIGELAKLTGCSVQSIRHYEKAGLLPNTVRTSGNYRWYSEEGIERLQFIKKCRQLDLSINDIRQLILLSENPEEECESVNSLIDKYIVEIELKIKSFNDLKKQLVELRQQCSAGSKVRDCLTLSKLRK